MDDPIVRHLRHPILYLNLLSAPCAVWAAPLDLEEIVVTASAQPLRKMEQSLSVSSLYQDQTLFSATTNTAELLRTVPGVRSESSGGEGNANLTVRGLPISAGGARYVQLQEDGLPVLQFGDIAFATADQFVRSDRGLDRIEVVRGGSASTQATNAPGGVINIISNTGEEAGGLVAASTGLDYARLRYDFAYGQPLANQQTRFAVSGFYREGDSERDHDVKVEQGGQLKANLTHEFDQGYLRVYGKVLQDHTPMWMPVPVTAQDGRIHTLPGIDPRQASFYSTHWGRDTTLTSANRLRSTPVNDGLSVDSRVLGSEMVWQLSDSLTLENRTRFSDNRGRFIGIFPADNGYSNGPFSLPGGEPFNGSAFTGTVFNVALNDLGNTINDVAITKIVALSDDQQLTLGAGFYYSEQAVDLTWQFNQYLLSLDGNNPHLLSSPQTTPLGLLAWGTDVWGGCCSRDIDVDYTTRAPYVSLNWASGPWTLDASLRDDQQRAHGEATQAENQRYLPGNRQRVHYEVDETAYSVGVNHLLHDDLALFVRTSEGFTFNADRILFSGAALDGSAPIPVNRVRQHELGVKWRTDALASFITLFDASTAESNYEATTQRYTTRTYDAQGVEVELSYQGDQFSFSAGATYTQADITRAEDPTLRGHTPRRQAPWMYQLQPSWQMGNTRIGLSCIGATEAWGDDDHTIRLGSYTLWNGFIQTQLTPEIEATLQINNMTNELAYTEVEGSGHAARAMNGRSAMASVTYRF